MRDTDRDSVRYTIITIVKHDATGMPCVRDGIARINMYIPGVMKVLNISLVITFLLDLGLKGAFVNRTGCSSGAML